jgi:glycosyltransferase involved in cell wall biosynthesis
MNEKLPIIGIDARLYGPQQGGLGRYIAELIRHLEALAPAAELRIFLTKKNWDEYQPSNPSFKKILADVPWYGLAEQVTLPKIFKRERLNVLHVPHWNVPLNYHAPFVVTIHDLLLLHYPTRRASTLGPLAYWFKNRVFRRVLAHAATQSRHILTPSEFTKNDICQTLGTSPDKISVTPLAPLTSDTPPNPELVRSKYHITRPYVLYVGVAFPHKNLEGLAKAWKLVEEKTNGAYQLVLCGKRNYFYDQLLHSNAWKSLQHAMYTDFVPDAELSSLYAGAKLYVHPSLYEGSALPAFEALHFGTPVVASRSTCLPELLGSAAMYANAKDPRELAQAILTVLTDETTRRTILSAAPPLLAAYSWKNVAKMTWEVYKNSVY